MKLIFDYKFRFYTSKMNEICLHCHLLYFSSIILSFGHCDILDSDNHILTNKKISYSGRCSCRFFLKFLQKTWRCWRWTFSQNTGKIRDMIDLFRGFCCVCNFVGSWFLQTIMTIGSIFPGKKGCSCCLLVFRPCLKKKCW